LKRGKYPNYALCLQYGNILCTSVNLTNNECYWYPALGCYRTSSSTSYSSIVNNTANPSGCCIGLSSSSHCIDTCNILNNNQESNDGIIRTYNANLFIKDSCILGNNKRIFYATYSGKITISNCTIDDDIFTNTRYLGNVTVNKTIERSFNIVLSHIATQGCDSYITLNPCLLCKCSHTLMSCNCNYNFRDIYYYKLHRAFILN